MKLLPSIIILTASVFATAEGKTILIGDIEMRLDTVYHAKIGPGTTRTQLHLSGSQPLDVHYITIDRAAPGVSLRAAMANTAEGLEKTSSMGERLSADDETCIAGINGDFFDVNKTYPDGSARPRMSTYTTIIDGEIFKTSPQAHQFIVDKSGNTFISTLNFNNGSVYTATQSVAFGGLNIESINYSGDCAPDNAVTVYNNRGWKSPFQTQFAGNCAEVTAMPLDEEAIKTDASTRYKITSTASDTGNLSIPEGSCVLLGRGTGKNFIESLNIGDIVTIDPTAGLSDNTKIIPALAIGGNPRTVVNGVAVDSDGTRPDAVEVHPRTGIGMNADGSKIIMMVVDGRGASMGATTRQVGDLMVHAGATEALNFDGGGSSTCWTNAFGVVNTCSDKSGERPVNNAVFAVTKGNANDKNISEIRFEGWKYNLIEGESLTPRIYGYNTAGILIDTNLEGATLSCPATLGSLDNSKTVLTASGTSGILTAEYNGLKTNVLIDVIPVDFKNADKTASNWSITKTSVKTATLSGNNGTLTLDYQMGPTVNKPSITLKKTQEIEGRPLGMRIGVESKSLKDTQVSVAIKAANQSTPTTFDIQGNDAPLRAIIKFADKFNLDDEEIYPLTFSFITVKPAEQKTETGQVTFSDIDFIYQKSSAVNEISTDITNGGNNKEEWFSITGTRMNPQNLTPGIYILRTGTTTRKVLIK